ncbi:hypothetical protein [Grimontia sp. NTOU-MAR1]|uniref:hypothetical protein n=1 Tax=Grimontia sp. NTOU-MAR1 TaxID=3111011 RepID=UPI002DB799DB|nr:hypothetical protein [Grimontia sp. NTOU-MAR1]WRW00399.1 hypothetical protein VP504_18235 [Grimontia sp. NTOU-MAR1]
MEKMLLFMRFFSRTIAAFLLLPLVPTAYSEEPVDVADVHSERSTFDYQQANVSEPICRNNLRAQLLAQQIAFSDSENSPEQRRLAEESIDYARGVFEKSQSYCEASFALTEFLDRDLLEKAQVPKSGQVQSFDP